jgi:hypothetical protein
VTANYFDILGGRLALGRGFVPNEDRPGTDARLAIISHRLWQQRGADPDIVGRTIRINGDPFSVVGVAAEGFTGTGIPGPEVWLPLGADDRLSARDSHELAVIGRVRADVPVENVSAALATVARRLEQAFPEVNGGYTLTASPPVSPVVHAGDPAAQSCAARGVVDGDAGDRSCSSHVSISPTLLLARGHVRRQELAIRSSLGGGRWRITASTADRRHAAGDCWRRPRGRCCPPGQPTR